MNLYKEKDQFDLRAGGNKMKGGRVVRASMATPGMAQKG